MTSKNDQELNELNAALLQKFSEFQIIFDSMPQVIWTATTDGMIDYYNKRWDEYTGLAFKETAGTQWTSVVHPDDLGPCLEKWKVCLESGEPFTFEYRFRGIDGIYRWFDARAVAVRDSSGAITKWFGSSTNIDENKRAVALLEKKAEERGRDLIESERKFQAIFDQTLQFIGLLDTEGIILNANQTALSFANLSLSDVVGRHFWDTPWFSHSAELQQRLKTAIQKSAQGELVRLQYNHPTPDGLYHVDFSLKPIFDEKGKIKFLLPEGRDISDITQLTEKLAQSNKDLEQFAYVASHDLQEPLRTVLSFSSLLKKKSVGKLDKDSEKYLDVIVQSADRMQQLIKGLLVYSQVESQGKALSPVSLDEALKQSVVNLDSAINETSARITSDHLPYINGDLPQLTRLFQNLLGNSIKFRSDKPPEIHVSAELSADRLKLVIADNGIGISMDYGEKIFEVFQKLHSISQYPGTGIGLAVCRRIVERHGGSIALCPSTYQQGSAFQINLPLPASPADMSLVSDKF